MMMSMVTKENAPYRARRATGALCCRLDIGVNAKMVAWPLSSETEC
jgi:hypothetical protein